MVYFIKIRIQKQAKISMITTTIQRRKTTVTTSMVLAVLVKWLLWLATIGAVLEWLIIPKWEVPRALIVFLVILLILAVMLKFNFIDLFN